MKRHFILLEEILKKYLAVAQEMTRFSQMDDEIKDTYWFFQGQMMVLPQMIKYVEEQNVEEFWMYITSVRAKAFGFNYNLPHDSKNRYIYAGIQTIVNMIDTLDEIL